VSDPVGLISHLAGHCEAAPDPLVAFGAWPEPYAARAPASGGASLRTALDRFLEQLEEAERWRSAAFAGVSQEERTAIEVLAPAFWADPEDPLVKARKGAIQFERGEFADTTLEISEKIVLDAAARVDRAALTRAGELFALALGDLIGAIWKMPQPSAETELPGVHGRVALVEETPWGRIVIGGTDPNRYEATFLRETAIVIDLGGDDVYAGRAASALGGFGRPFAALVDGGGDDLYDAAGLDYALGGALFGVAVLVDTAGDDTYRARDGSLGAGFFGIGLLCDRSGRDRFESSDFGQGAGAIGLGALVSLSTPAPPPGPEIQEDRAYALGMVPVPGTGSRPVRWDEDDLYFCSRQSQGFAATFGAGLLFDERGSDVYRSGGRSLHAPLLPHDFQSLSQGFSIGFRPRAGGGVGILLDEEGNDFYDAEVYAQGVAYWYAIGLLFDGGGNDRYSATQYAQGAGVHLAAGSLWDRGGDDQFVSKFGVTQGTAHDLSAGLLIDEAGNDLYAVSDGQGISITNSVALFLDAQGDDHYATRNGGQAKIHWARGFSGAAFFLDLEGEDTYPEGADGADGAVWTPDLYAVGIDLDRDLALPDEKIPEPILTARDSLRSVEELFETAALWEVGSAREKVRRARKALRTKGSEAVAYVLEEKLHTDSGLEYRAILDLARADPDTFATQLLPRLEDPDERVVGNAVRLLGDLKAERGRGPLLRLLRDPARERHWNRAIHALGRIGEPETAPELRRFLDAPQERRRLATIGALASLRDTAAVPLLAAALDDAALTVRSAASRALVPFGAAAVPALAERIDADPAQPRAVLHTLARIGEDLADGTSAPSLRARGTIRRILMRVLEEGDADGDPALRAIAV
ncbi:MAG: hypothetical protein GF346_00290, partial [Candidatus Eisenbacteria bacterium]|nr:hypothetical protein [Candidatus Latescibacterota bacterium]MBD3300871.1 hypothetical protein [Candidatus Eisenbacteria bacterium]